MHVGIVGGNFDTEGGRPSKIVSLVAGNAGLMGNLVSIWNGGNYDKLPGIIEKLEPADIIIWLANVPNDLPKVRNIKEIYPNKIVITSKRNYDSEYPLSYLVNHALGLKSNLLIEFTKRDDVVFSRVIDPLGTVWCDYDNDIVMVTYRMLRRAEMLTKFTRKGANRAGDAIQVPDETRFFGLVKGWAETFHDLINPEKEVTRFLGNASFRCQRGFPSFRGGEYIFVSRRNVDKRYIDQSGFVATKLVDGEVQYWGDNKPSVDTPVQLRLYDYYPNVNYMVHSHTYVKGAPYTRYPIPCGAIEEVDEITRLFPDQGSANFAVNLIGHGCLVFANSTYYLNSIEFVSRPAPEIANILAMDLSVISRINTMIRNRPNNLG